MPQLIMQEKKRVKTVPTKDMASPVFTILDERVATMKSLQSTWIYLFILTVNYVIMAVSSPE